MTIKKELTLHPKSQASKDLFAIALDLCKTAKESFIEAQNTWRENVEGFLTERARGKDIKMHYVPKNTRSAYFSEMVMVMV